MPGTLSGGGCGDGATLELATSDTSPPRLKGTKDGRLVCEHDALKKATFSIRSGGTSVDLAIDDVQQITEGEHSFEGYRIMRDGLSACNYHESLEILKQLGFHPDPAPAQAYPPSNDEGSNADYVIAIGGPIYDVVDATVIPTEENGFFDLACAGDALAKTVFFDLQEHEKAALRMITAKYASNRAYTVPGMTIAWKQSPTTDRKPPPIEARWDADGKVVCLDHPRLMDAKDTGKPVDTELFGADLQPCGCLSTQEGGLPGRCKPEEWREHLQSESLVDPKKECSSVPAGSYVLTSWSDPDGKLILTSRNKPPTVTSPQQESAPMNRDPAATR